MTTTSSDHIRIAITINSWGSRIHKILLRCQTPSWHYIISGIRAAITYEDSDYEIINFSNHQTGSLTHLIGEIEDISGQKARINRLPLQPGDVPKTYADISKARDLLGYEPKTELKSGLKSFYNWYNAQTAQVSRV